MMIDRIVLAERLSAGARVLDIGGQKMAGCDPGSPFALRYADIERAAAEYRIADYQRKDSVDYVIDFNEAESIPAIRQVLDQYKPEVILCMETLEHVNYHHELMNELARCVERHNCIVFITIPNNGNWVLNAMGWNRDHSIAFFRDIAFRFVTRSRLGRHRVLVAPCMQTYLWYWPSVYLLSLLQPISWGFLVTPSTYRPRDDIEDIFRTLAGYTHRRFGRVEARQDALEPACSD